jgi:predicted Zn-dependent protease with MMP-like domain
MWDGMTKRGTGTKLTGAEEWVAPDLADIEALARGALAAIPEELRGHADGVVIRVEDFPDPETACR